MPIQGRPYLSWVCNTIKCSRFKDDNVWLDRQHCYRTLLGYMVMCASSCYLFYRAIDREATVLQSTTTVMASNAITKVGINYMLPGESGY